MNSKTDKHSGQQLHQLFSREPNGSRNCVLVVGSGVNLQAAKIEGETDDNWSGLLERIAAEMDQPARWLNSLPQSNLSRWESMLRFWARKKNIEPYQAEVALQQFACQYLRQQEAKAKDWTLYRELASARFHNIISLNFDRRIALSWDKTLFLCAPAKCAEGGQGESLYRNDLLSHPTGSCTRIWYPHGDTKKYSTLKLGNRRYGFYVVTLEESDKQFGESWRFKRAWHQWESESERTSYDAAPKWTSVFLNSHLVFIGCGLSLDEWPLWWMIRRRALKNLHAGEGSKKTTCYVTTSQGQTDSNLRTILHLQGIETLLFPSFDEMWVVIRSSIV